MPWSSQYEEACEYLSKSAECEGDIVLVSLARLTKIAICAMEVSRRASEDSSFAQHATMAIEPLKLALNNLRISLSPKILQYRKSFIPFRVRYSKSSRQCYRFHVYG